MYCQQLYSVIDVYPCYYNIYHKLCTYVPHYVLPISTHIYLYIQWFTIINMTTWHTAHVAIWSPVDTHGQHWYCSIRYWYVDVDVDVYLCVWMCVCMGIMVICLYKYIVCCLYICIYIYVYTAIYTIYMIYTLIYYILTYVYITMYITITLCVSPYIGGISIEYPTTACYWHHSYGVRTGCKWG